MPALLVRAIPLLLLGALSGAGSPAKAQDAAATAALPVPADRYLARDAAAVMPEQIGATDNRARQELEKLLEYSPQHVPARVQNAFHLVARGLNRRAEQEFEYAIRVAKPESLAARHAHWAYGWGLFRMGEVRRAIEQWMEAERMHGERPAWAPWTYAIGLWVAGDTELALRFWTAAVRSDPERWGATRGLDREVRDWPANQRLAAEGLHTEWKRRLTAQQ